jgi:DNA recombination protein RmuC
MWPVREIALIAAGAISGFGVAWLMARYRFSQRYATLMITYKTETASLSKMLEGKTSETKMLYSRLEMIRSEHASLGDRFFKLSNDHCVALSKLEDMKSDKAELAALKMKNSRLAETIGALEKDQAKLETIIEKERSMAEEKVGWMEDSRNTMKETYRALSAHALKENNRSFLDLAQTAFSKYLAAAQTDFDFRNQAVKDILQPVSDALKRYDSEIRNMEREREKAYGSLSQQVNMLNDTQLSLKEETAKLAKALNEPHVRGRWGEITLKRVVELAGMTNRCDFFEQPSIQTKTGAVRPDMRVLLPGGRQIIIDAKVPLSAYLKAMEAKEEKERDRFLADHANQVKAHINQLGQKAYWTQFTPTPDFVILFIPGENFFSAALAKQPALIETGVRKGVILATPTTLISLLRTIAFAWRQETVAQNTLAISELGNELYTRLHSMVTHINNLGQHIERCSATYNQVIGSLESRVLIPARKFKDLGLSLKQGKNIPSLRPVEASVRTTRSQSKR